MKRKLSVMEEGKKGNKGQRQRHSKNSSEQLSEKTLPGLLIEKRKNGGRAFKKVREKKRAATKKRAERLAGQKRGMRKETPIINAPG